MENGKPTIPRMNCVLTFETKIIAHLLAKIYRGYLKSHAGAYQKYS